MAAKPKFIPDPRYWTEYQLACRLNKSVQWLRQHRERLEGQGLPKPDPDFGYDSEAVERWLDLRSGLRTPSPSDQEQEALRIIHGGKARGRSSAQA